MARLGRPYVEALRRLVADHAGLDIPDERTGELAEIVGARLRATGTDDPALYIAQLEAKADGGRELARIVEALVVGETYFFRDGGQLAALVGRVLPERARSGGRLRILSAGASTGAEPYTVAILVRERFPELAAAIDIVGIDLSAAAIEVARRGRWLPWALRETPPEIVARYFRLRGRFRELRADVRAMVSLEVRNLLAPGDPFWAPESFDVIFCRNLLMYLAPERAQAAVARLERCLRRGGYLFLGHTETLRGFATELVLQSDVDAFYYQRPALPRADPGRARDLRRDLGGRPRRPRSPGAPAARREAPPPPPPSPVALTRRALALVEHGDLAEAEEACARAHAADDLDPVPRYLMALCRERAGDRAGAIRHATAAAYLDPTFAMPCLHLALLARRGGDLRTARRELSRALALLTREEDDRLHLLGGGLDREALVRICCAELRAVGTSP